ncbi:MAG: hypothetical protein ACXADH_18675, partial [Candidatus Kariarchaeaceae archaeon]
MDLKKIILEEIDSFGWVSDALNFNPDDPNTWVGKRFGYSDNFRRDTMSPDNPERLDTWLITGVADGSGTAVYIKKDGDSKTIRFSSRNLIGGINDG